MRSRIVTRYYCDHCKKATLTRASMERHEQSCTANPDRVCKMCLLRAQWDEDAPKQRPSSEIAALIDSFDWTPLDPQPEQEKSIRDFCGDCPACLLAGSRLSKNGLPFNFDWKEESRNWLGEYGRQETYP